MKKFPHDQGARATIACLLLTLLAFLPEIGLLVRAGTPTTLTAPVPTPVMQTNGVIVGPANFAAANNLITNGTPVGMATNAAFAAQSLHSTNADIAPVNRLSGAGAGVTNALVNPTAGTGTQVLMALTDVNGNVTAGTTSGGASVNLASDYYLGVPNVELPASVTGNVLFDGDSLTEGIGTPDGAAQSARAYAGLLDSYPDYMSSMAPVMNAAPYNFGVSGDKLVDMIGRFSATTGSVTGTTTANSTSVPVATLTGISIGLGIAAANNGIPFQATITGTTTGTVTLSQAATATGSTTLYFSGVQTFHSGSTGSFTSAPWLLQPNITGTPAYFLMNIGTNDYGSYGESYTGSFTAGSGTITGLAITGSISFGSALSTDVNYNVWGVTSTGTISLGTVSSVPTGSSIVVTNGAAVTSAMTAIRMCPQLTSSTTGTWTGGWEGGYSSFVNTLVSDGFKVMVTTVLPFGNYDSWNSDRYTAYNCNRLLMNQWITSTYAGGAVSGVTYADPGGSIPELQFGPNYDAYRNTVVSYHLNYLGYLQEATYLARQFQKNYPVTGFFHPFTSRSIPPAWEPTGLVYWNGTDTTGWYAKGPLPPSGTGTITWGGGTGARVNQSGNYALLNVAQISMNGEIDANDNRIYLDAARNSYLVAGGTPTITVATGSITGANITWSNNNGSGGLATNPWLRYSNPANSNNTIQIMNAGWISGSNLNGNEIDFRIVGNANAANYAVYGVKAAPNGLYVFAGNGTSNDLSNTSTDGGDALDITGSIGLSSNLKLNTAGGTLSIKGGSNAASGTITLASGSGTVTSSAVQAGDSIGLSPVTFSGVSISTAIYPMAIATSGTITFQSSPADNSTWKWWITHTAQ